MPGRCSASLVAGAASLGRSAASAGGAANRPGPERAWSDGMSPVEEPETAIVPEAAPTAGQPADEPVVRCGRWKLKPFELPRPVILRPDGPLSLRDFLDHPDPTVLDDLNRLDEEGLQELALARLAGAPPRSE